MDLHQYRPRGKNVRWKSLEVRDAKRFQCEKEGQKHNLARLDGERSWRASYVLRARQHTSNRRRSISEMPWQRS